MELNNLTEHPDLVRDEVKRKKKKGGETVNLTLLSQFSKEKKDSGTVTYIFAVLVYSDNRSRVCYTRCFTMYMFSLDFTLLASDSAVYLNHK